LKTSYNINEYTTLIW